MVHDGWMGAEPMTTQLASRRTTLLRRARWLAVFTVVWNLAEGAVAMVAAGLAGSRALIGFGVDSLVESASAAVLIWRLGVEQRAPERAELVERRALRIIGVTFLALAALVGVESVRSLLAGDQPDVSRIGIVLTVVSLIVMPVLARAKQRVGRELDARSVEADSQQTMACVYLSAVVLAGLAANAAFGWWWADPVAALGVVAFLVAEGREALEAEHVDDCC
jgi:divalent metal cation (Fe/Co/Zn/Cd) transporter